MEEFSSFGRDLFPYWKRICHDDEDEISGRAALGEKLSEQLSGSSSQRAALGEQRVARGEGLRAGAHQIPGEEWIEIEILDDDIKI